MNAEVVLVGLFAWYSKIDLEVISACWRISASWAAPASVNEGPHLKMVAI